MWVIATCSAGSAVALYWSKWPGDRLRALLANVAVSAVAAMVDQRFVFVADGSTSWIDAIFAVDKKMDGDFAESIGKWCLPMTEMIGAIQRRSRARMEAAACCNGCV